MAVLETRGAEKLTCSQRKAAKCKYDARKPSQALQSAGQADGCQPQNLSLAMTCGFRTSSEGLRGVGFKESEP